MITIRRERCLNTRYKAAKCDICRRQCPARAISPSFVPEAGRCTDCGLCLAACPAEAIAGSSYPNAVFARLAEQDDDPLVLACGRQDGQSLWPCLGVLDGRLLLALIYRGQSEPRQVVLDDYACAQCIPRVAAHLGLLRSAVNQLMADSGKIPAIWPKRAEPAPRREKAISRRAFFNGLVAATLLTVCDAAIAGAGEDEPLKRHEWFLRYGPRTQLALPVGSSLFWNIAIDDGCNCCRGCLEACPHQAITAEDGGSELRFNHNPLLCSGCGDCAACCPLAALTLQPAARLDAYPVATRQFPRCQGCGELFQPAGKRATCLECLLKAAAAAFGDDGNTKSDPQ